MKQKIFILLAIISIFSYFYVANYAFAEGVPVPDYSFKYRVKYFDESSYKSSALGCILGLNSPSISSATSESGCLNLNIKSLVPIVTLLALGIIIYAGIKIITSRDKEDAITKSKSLIIGATSGLLIINLLIPAVVSVRNFFLTPAQQQSAIASGIANDNCQPLKEGEKAMTKSKTSNENNQTTSLRIRSKDGSIVSQKNYPPDHDFGAECCGVNWCKVSGGYVSRSIIDVRQP